MSALSPRATRVVVTLVSAASLGAFGALVGLWVGGLLTAPRSAEAQAIHVAPVSGEMIVGLLYGAGIGLVGGVLVGLATTRRIAEVRPGRGARVAGEVVFAVGGLLAGLAVYFVVASVAGLGVGVFIGGRMLGGRGTEVDVIIGLLAGAGVGAVLFFFIPETGIPAIGEMGDVSLLVRITLAHVFALVGAIIGFEKHADREQAPAGS